MHPEPIKKLIEYFTRLPGIGPRQAARFAYTLLDEDEATIKGFGEALADIAGSIERCGECHRTIQKDLSENSKCETCRTDKMEALLVVEKDQDLETIAKSGTWNNGFHVLGGTVSLMNEKTRVTERIRSLHKRINERTKAHSPLEVVLATSTTTEGDATALYIERVLEPFLLNGKVKVTRLARGISTGTEMEFADPQTLTNAIKDRK
ncbi:MAG: toprim domain-containing protein [bacterium]|nr:toprim domain-containing protein [bacterium]